MTADIREARKRRHERIRKKVAGTPERPRLSVYRSLDHMYAQIIDDYNKQTVVSASSIDKEFKDKKSHKGNIATAKQVGGIHRQEGVRKRYKKGCF